MKTTELVVEQVLTGFLVLVFFALTWTGELDTDQVNVYVGSAAVLALAYLVGVLFDRFADTLLSRAEQVGRLDHARQQGDKSNSSGDPFPEDRLRVLVLKHGGALEEWMSYLRTRIRIIRGVVVFLPAVTLVAAARRIGCEGCVVTVSGLVVLAYAGMFLATISMRRLPRTDEKAPERALSEFRCWHDPLSWGAVAWLLGASTLSSFGVRQGGGSAEAVAGILAAGAALSALAFWSWRRVTKTLMGFLSTCGEELRNSVDSSRSGRNPSQ